MNTIRNRLILFFGIIIVFAVGFSGWLLYWTVKSSLEEELGNKLKAVASIAAAQLKSDLILQLEREKGLNRTYENVQRQLRTIRKSTDVKKVYIFDRKLRSIVDSQGNVSPGAEYVKLRFDKLEIDKAFNGQLTSSVLFKGEDGNLYKTGFAPIIHNGERIAVVGVEGSATFLNSVQEIRRSLLMVAGVSVFISIILAAIFSRSIIKPVNTLVRAAKKIGSGNYKSGIRLERGDEIGFLGRTMEDMRRSIVQRESEMKLMLAGVAHEIRNPLGGIELFAGLLKDEIQQEHPSHTHIDKIVQEVQNLKKIVTNFLEYARPGEGEKEEFEVKELIKEISEVMGGDLHNSGIKLEVKGNGRIFANRNQIKQVFLNLMKNSLNFMNEHGKIEIILRDEKGRSNVLFRDTGPGIDKSIRKKIFDPFFSTTEKGTGLGLAIAKKIVHENSGNIVLDENYSNGTGFIITLPSTSGKG